MRNEATATLEDTGRSTGVEPQDSGTGSHGNSAGGGVPGTDLRTSILNNIKRKSDDIRRRRTQQNVEVASDQSGPDSAQDRRSRASVQSGLARGQSDASENGDGHRSDGRLHGRTRRTNRPIGNGDGGDNPASERLGEPSGRRDATRPSLVTETLDDGTIVIGPDEFADAQPPKKRGRPRKNPQIQQVVDAEPEVEDDSGPHVINPLTLFRAGSKLTQDEANTLRPFLLEAVRTYSDYADDAITHSNRDHVTAEIWSTMDDKEIACVVDTLLMGGRKSAQIAFVAREMVRLWRMVQVGVILIPRWFKTMRFYTENGGFGLW